MERQMTAEALGAFDLVLAYPQWQGSGRGENLPRGAAAAAQVCGRFGPMETVQISPDLTGANGVNCWSAIFDQFRSAQGILDVRRPKRLLTAGGDCAVDIATIDYLNGLYPNLTVVWIDAHLDANTPETSPSGNFHGMPVSAILGRAPEAMQRLLGAPIDPGRFHYFGTQVGDEGDWALQREYDLKTLDPGSSISGPVHIHFDLDVLDPHEFPYLAYTDGKVAVEDAVGLVSKIAQDAELVGLTVTEFSPASEAEAEEGSKIIAQLCQAALAHQGS
jgi:arginase